MKYVLYCLLWSYWTITPKEILASHIRLWTHDQLIKWSTLQQTTSEVKWFFTTKYESKCISSSVKILHGVNVQGLLFQNAYKICLLASGVTYPKWKTKDIGYPCFPWVSWLTTCSSSAMVQECFTIEPLAVTEHKSHLPSQTTTVKLVF